MTMSSREMAELTGKRHDNVKRTIEALSASGVIRLPQFEEVLNPGSGRKKITEYRLCKRDSFVVVAQLSPEFTAALVDRWQALEQSQQISLPANFAEALRLAADQHEQIELQKAKIASDAPKVAFVDHYVESDGLKGFRQVAKLLSAKENKLRDFLVERRIMYRLSSEWMPYQVHVDAGRFEIRAGASDGGHAFNQAKFTPKGVQWLSELWMSRGLV